MAMSWRTTLRNASLDAITSDVGANCYIRIYSGTRPANVGTALSGNTLLAELRGNATFAPGAASGVLTLNAITADSSADATGTATFARIFKSDGTTAVFDCSVGTSATDIVLNTVSIVTAANVAISAFTITDGNP